MFSVCIIACARWECFVQLTPRQYDLCHKLLPGSDESSWAGFTKVLLYICGCKKPHTSFIQLCSALVNHSSPCEPSIPGNFQASEH